MSELRWPCKIGSDGLRPCHGLDDCLELGGAGKRYQGLKLQTLIDIKSGTFSRHLVTLKSGKHSKNGLVFNFCPFCGEEILKSEPDDELSPGADVKSPQATAESDNG